MLLDLRWSSHILLVHFQCNWALSRALRRWLTLWVSSLIALIPTQLHRIFVGFEFLAHLTLLFRQRISHQLRGEHYLVHHERVSHQFTCSVSANKVEKEIMLRWLVFVLDNSLHHFDICFFFKFKKMKLKNIDFPTHTSVWILASLRSSITFSSASRSTTRNASHCFRRSLLVSSIFIPIKQCIFH